MAKLTKTETITIRATRPMKKLAEKSAAAEHRSLANYFAHLVECAGKQSNNRKIAS